MAKFILYGAVALYVISLFSPAIIVQWDTAPVKYGLELLTYGWIGPLAGIFAWYANIFALIALFFATNEKYKTSIVLILIAFILGLQTFFMERLPIGDTEAWILYLGFGYYLWQLSFVLLALYSCLKIGRPVEIAEIILKVVLGLVAVAAIIAVVVY